MKKQMKIGDKTYSLASDDEYLRVMGDVFEPHMVDLYHTLITPDDVVADIGANIGLTTILFSEIAKHVYSFEPSPSTFDILIKNLARNCSNNFDAVNIGLGSKKESLKITFSENNRSGGYVSNKIRPQRDHITEDIKIDTLDKYFASSQLKPTFFKIDVEGFEPNVIKGSMSFIKKHKPTVVMGMNHFCLNVLHKVTIPDFLDFMRSVFPRLYAVEANNSEVIDLHIPDDAYMVMHEHVVRNRFPNLVGGFSESIKTELEKLSKKAKNRLQ